MRINISILKKSATRGASISALPYSKLQHKFGWMENPYREVCMMTHSLSRTMVLVAIVILAAGTFGFGQTTSQTQIAGGTGGNPFQDISIPSNARVSEVRIASGAYVDSVQLGYVHLDGRAAMGSLNGGTGGQVSTFRLDSDEYIVAISGRYGKYIDSLRIHTNRRTSPFYGGSGGAQDFRIDIPSGNQVVGFIGRSGKYLDAIGLVYARVYLHVAGKTKVAGGSGGTAFLDSEIPYGARITEIRIQAGKYIDGIQVLYTLPDGTTVEGPFHGGRGGNTQVFRLESNEFITGISGRYGEYMDSLMIHTNRRTSSRYGGSGGRQDFRIDVPSGNRAVGLIGRAGKYLDAIGFSYASASSGSQSRGFFRRRDVRESN
jgi:hypothetical protein